MITGWTVPENPAFFEIAGPDAVRFLNGQITNDISGDLSEKIVAACVCTMKGKVEALIRVTKGFSDQGLLIEVDAGIADAVFQRLDRYLIADDCKLVEFELPSGLTHIIGAPPPEGDAREHWRYGLQGYDVFGTPDLSSLDELDDTVLAQQKILHGIPEHGFEITGEEFPAELGLDKWAVDFHKGCYLGQEIVSRIESVGKVPKRLRLFSTDVALEHGQTFTNDAGKEIARTVRASVDHPDESGRFLSSVLAKAEFERPGFEELEIRFPPKW